VPLRGVDRCSGIPAARAVYAFFWRPSRLSCAFANGSFLLGALNTEPKTCALGAWEGRGKWRGLGARRCWRKQKSLAQLTSLAHDAPMSEVEEPKLLVVFPDGASRWVYERDMAAARASGAIVTAVRGVGDGWAWDRGGLFRSC